LYYLIEVEHLEENSKGIDVCTHENVWITKGFSAFKKGIFGKFLGMVYFSGFINTI
jgi:hypothetical protein